MADLDPVARARAIAARLAASAVPSDALGKRKSRWEEDADEGARPNPGAPGKKRKKIYIPVDEYRDINFIGLLIGPRGSNQKRMEDESGARILIRGKGSSKEPTGDPDEEEELHVLILADSDESIAKAQSAVEEILFNPRQAMKLKQEQLRKVAELNGTLNDNYRPSSSSNDGPQGHYGPGGSGGGGAAPDKDVKTTEMKVPRDLVGYIIGRGGETIRDLQAKSGGHIQIVREEDGAPQLPDRYVSISGTDEALELAQKLIQNLIDERQQNSGMGGGFRERDDRDRMARYGGINPDGSESLELLIPNERVGLIIGRGGATIKAIQTRTGSTITIPQTPDPNHPDMRLITIRGTVDAKELGRQEIMAMVNEEPGRGHGGGGGGGGYGSTTIYMQVPNERVGVVIGKRGETIKGIQDRHLVRIQIPQVTDPGSSPPVRTISIQGPQNNLQGAKEEIDMIILQGAGSQGGYGGSSQYGGSSNYGSSSYGSGDYNQQYDPYGQQQYGYGQEQYDAYYQQQYYQQDGSAAATSSAAAPGTEAAASTAASTDSTATGATADPNDPNAYWNGYYEYAAYYGIDAANAAWGVTGEAAVAAAESYRQYQEQMAASGGGGGGGGDSSAAPEAPSSSQAQGPPGTA